MTDYKYLADHIDGIGATYWAPTLFGFDDAGFKVEHYVDPDDYSEGTQTTEVSWAKLAEALQVMAGGEYITYADERARLADYHAIAARDLVHSKQRADDDADADADTWDTALQLATLGRVYYG